MVNGTPGWGGYYLSAYGIAVKHGYTGTEEEWLESLNGADVEMRFQDEVMQWKTVREKEWHTMEGFQKYIEELRTAKSEAEEAAGAATDAVKNIETKTAELSSAAEAALQSANAASNSATEAVESVNAMVETVNTAAEAVASAAEGLDEKIGEHLENTDIHLNTGEKEFLSRPYSFYVHRGNGNMSYTIKGLPGGKEPRLILAMCQEFPPCTVGTDGSLNVYWDFWMKAGSSTSYGGGGIAVDAANNSFTMKNRVKPAGSWYSCTRNLNENGKIYVLLFFYDPPTS